MDTETGWQSNCSELVIVLGGNKPSDMYAVFKTITETLEDFTVGVRIYDFNGNHEGIFYPITDLSMLKFVKRKEGHYEILVSIREILRSLGRPVNDGIGEDLDWDTPRLALGTINDVREMQYGESIGVFPFEEFNYSLCAMSGDCDTRTFPLMEALKDLFHGEVHPYDGGHTGTFEEWERYWSDKDYRKEVDDADRAFELHGSSYGTYPPIKCRMPPLKIKPKKEKKK